MNDRTFKALERAGVPETPLAGLDYEQQLFALTAQHLVFEAEEGGPQQQVALRDITRIHSDQTGTLRIETGSRTAITASLLGYNAERVQRFFQLVRDTTARAKQLPATPAPATPSFFGKPSTVPSPAPFAPAVAPASTVPSVPLAEQLATADLPRPSLTPLSDLLAATPLPPIESLPPNAAHPKAAGPQTTNPAVTDPGVTSPDAATANAFQIGAATPSTGVGLPTATPVSNNTASDNSSTIRLRANPKSAPVPESVTDTAADAGPQPQAMSAAAPANLAKSSEAAIPSNQPATQEVTAPLLLSQSELLRRARSVGGLSGTVRVLALVLVLGSLGMGYVMWQKQSQHIPALWTVTIGIVTAVALLVLAEVLRYLAALGQSVAEQGKGR